MNRPGEKSMATDCTKQPNKAGFQVPRWQRTAQNGQTRGGASAATWSILQGISQKPPHPQNRQPQTRLIPLGTPYPPVAVSQLSIPFCPAPPNILPSFGTRPNQPTAAAKTSPPTPSPTSSALSWPMPAPSSTFQLADYACPSLLHTQHLPSPLTRAACPFLEHLPSLPAHSSQVPFQSYRSSIFSPRRQPPSNSQTSYRNHTPGTIHRPASSLTKQPKDRRQQSNQTVSTSIRARLFLPPPLPADASLHHPSPQPDQPESPQRHPKFPIRSR